MKLAKSFTGAQTSNFRLLFKTSGKSVYDPFLSFFSMITIVFCSLSFYCWCCLFFSAPSPLACVWRSSLASRFPSLRWKNAKNNPCYAGHVLSWKFSLPHSSLFSNVTQPCVTFWQWCCLLSVSNQDGCLLTPSARFLRSDRKIGDYKRHGTLYET